MSATKTQAIHTLMPLNQRVIVRPIEADEKTAGGLIIPDNARDKPQEGVVVAVPEDEDGGVRAERTGRGLVLVGDKVLFGKWSGTEIKHEGSNLLIMREDELICRIL